MAEHDIPLPTLSLLHDRRVLIAHDDGFVGKYLIAVLRGNGADVVVIRSADDATAHLSRRIDVAALSVAPGDGASASVARMLMGKAIPFLLWSTQPDTARLPDLPDMPVLCWPFAAYQMVDTLRDLMLRERATDIRDAGDWPHASSRPDPKR